MYNYNFINNSDSIIPINLIDVKFVVPAKGSVKFILDDTSPVLLRVDLSRMKKIYNDYKSYILALREVKKAIGNYRFEYKVFNYDGSEYTPVKAVKEEEKLPPVLKTIEIESYHPVMHVGEIQSVEIKTTGFDADERVKLTSSNTSVAKVTRNGKIYAQGTGDAVITATIGDLSKRFAVEVLELKDLEG